MLAAVLSHVILSSSAPTAGRRQGWLRWLRCACRFVVGAARHQDPFAAFKVAAAMPSMVPLVVAGSLI